MALSDLSTVPILKTYAIIVAGGSGTRMHSTVPKQFLPLDGKPVLMHTIAAFHNCEAEPHIILALHADFHDYWKELCSEHNFDVPHQLITGGDTRFHSVKNGLNLIRDDENTIIAIHDAVRPLTTREVIDESYRYAAEYGNAIAAVKSRDSVRQLQDSHSIALQREEIYMIQTPQTFQARQLKKAYEQHYSPKFTDDASVVEQSGMPIYLISGSYQNFKITFPEDIAIAELLLAKKLVS